MTTQYQYLSPGFDHSALRLDDGTQRLVADYLAGNLNAEQMARHRYQMNLDRLDGMSTDSLAPGNGHVFANELEHMLEEMQVEFEDLDLFRLFATDTRVPAGARTYAVKRMEANRNRAELNAEQRRRVLYKLQQSALFEQFLNKKYVAVTRFSL